MPNLTVAGDDTRTLSPIFSASNRKVADRWESSAKRLLAVNLRRMFEALSEVAGVIIRRIGFDAVKSYPPKRFALCWLTQFDQREVA